MVDLRGAANNTKDCLFRDWGIQKYGAQLGGSVGPDRQLKREGQHRRAGWAFFVV
jgi:hypothetical protein